MKERNRCLQTYLSTRLETDKKEMRRMRNLVNISVKNAKADYVRDQLETHKNDSKKFWKELNNIIPNSSAQNVNNIKDDHQDVIPGEIFPSIVNNYFANIGIELDKKKTTFLELVGTNPNRIYDIEPLNSFINITEEELIKEIKLINIYKSSGFDIQSYFLKICFELIPLKLLVIMNKSLFTGYFPLKWKKAPIIPIPKVNIPEDIGDLRPIALTPLPGKILERFVHTQLLAHLIILTFKYDIRVSKVFCS